MEKEWHDDGYSVDKGDDSLLGVQRHYPTCNNPASAMVQVV